MSDAPRVTYIIEPNNEVGFIGRTRRFPFITVDGQTPEACLAELIVATRGAAEAIKGAKAGDAVPIPNHRS